MIPLIQLLDQGTHDGVDYDFWNSQEGLKNISTFAHGIGPWADQLIVFDESNQQIMPSQLYFNAKQLGLLMHPYTFRIDSLPRYAKDYNNLIKIFLDYIQVDGLFTDFPDITINYLKKNSNYCNEANIKRTNMSLFLILNIILSTLIKSI